MLLYDYLHWHRKTCLRIINRGRTFHVALGRLQLECLLCFFAIYTVNVDFCLFFSCSAEYFLFLFGLIRACLGYTRGLPDTRCYHFWKPTPILASASWSPTRTLHIIFKGALSSLLYRTMPRTTRLPGFPHHPPSR